MLRRISSFLIFGTAVLLSNSSGKAQETVQLEVIGAPKQTLANSTNSKSGCCSSSASAQKIIVEVPPPEIVIQRAGGICAPEPTTFLQRCNHFCYRQVTRAHGHGSPPVSGIPMMYAPQTFAQQSYVPQTFAAQSFVPQSFAAQSYMPQSFMPQSFMPSFAPQSFAAQSFVPQSFVPQSFVPQSFVPQSFAPQSFVPQSFTPQSGPADGMDIRAAVKSLSENMEAATKLLKGQAQILKIHDDAIANIKSDLDATKALLAPLSGRTITVDPVTNVVTAPVTKK